MSLLLPHLPASGILLMLCSLLCCSLFRWRRDIKMMILKEGCMHVHWMLTISSFLLTNKFLFCGKLREKFSGVISLENLLLPGLPAWQSAIQSELGKFARQPAGKLVKSNKDSHSTNSDGWWGTKGKKKVNAKLKWMRDCRSYWSWKYKDRMCDSFWDICKNGEYKFKSYDSFSLHFTSSTSSYQLNDFVWFLRVCVVWKSFRRKTKTIYAEFYVCDMPGEQQVSEEEKAEKG